MKSQRERIISVHRYDVKAAPSGKLSVWSTCLFLNVIDVVLLASLIAGNYWAVQMFDIRFLTVDIAISAVATLLGFAFLIPGTFFTLLSLATCFTRALHTAFVGGRIIAMLIICGATSGSLMAQFDFLMKLETGLETLSYTIFVALIRYFNIFLIIFFNSTLERIRATGGTGREKMSAKEIDMAKYRSTLPHALPMH